MKEIALQMISHKLRKEAVDRLNTASTGAINHQMLSHNQYCPKKAKFYHQAIHLASPDLEATDSCIPIKHIHHFSSVLICM